MIKRFIIILLLINFSIMSSESKNWYVFVSEDEMTGEKTCYVHSNYESSPTRKMSFPYQSVRASFIIGSFPEKYKSIDYVAILFTEQPNLVDGDTEDGYDLFKTRIKFDSFIKEVEYAQSWGENFIHFLDDDFMLKKLSSSSTVLFELNWYGEGSVYFKFNVSGLKSVLEEARKKCKK